MQKKNGLGGRAAAGWSAWLAGLAAQLLAGWLAAGPGGRPARQAAWLGLAGVPPTLVFKKTLFWCLKNPFRHAWPDGCWLAGWWRGCAGWAGLGLRPEPGRVWGAAGHRAKQIPRISFGKTEFLGRGVFSRGARRALLKKSKIGLLKSIVFFSYLGVGLGRNFGKGVARRPLKQALAQNNNISKGKPR